MNVAICYSPDWAEHVRLEVYALQQTNPGATVYLVSDSAGRLELPGCVYVDVEDLYHERIPSSVNVDGRFTRYALYRLLLPEVIPESRVLYLDADTIVDGSLQALWDFGLSEAGSLLAGVQDIGMTDAQLAAVGLKPGDPYVNAGVTLMDLDAIRASALPRLWLRHINSTWYSCHDQDVLNLTCQGRISLVGNEWNSSLSTGHHPAPKITHYAGPANTKPWVNLRVRHGDIWQRWAQQYAEAHQ